MKLYLWRLNNQSKVNYQILTYLCFDFRPQDDVGSGDWIIPGREADFLALLGLDVGPAPGESWTLEVVPGKSTVVEKGEAKA